MTFELPADVERIIREIVKEGQGHRKYENLVAEWKVRTKHQMWVINNSKERMMFLMLTWAELNPDSPFAKWITDAFYEDKHIFEKLDLPSSDTILKDNRELERKGLFAKVAKVVQQTLG